MNYLLTGRTLTFTVPAAALNVSAPFVYSLELANYGSTTSSYTGQSGEPIIFTAPASVSGKIYRDRSSFMRFENQGKGTVVRNVITESTIIFDNDEQFTYLVDRSGESPPDTDQKTRLLPPKPNGKYRFTRTSNSAAVITLEFEDGTTARRSLVFTTPTSGVNGSPSEDGVSQLSRTFSLTDIENWKTSAARNVSMRGTVGPGRPLVVGLIVPGTREVLIRAIGPSLRSFGITTVWPDPDFQIFRGSQLYESSARHSADWGAPNAGSASRADSVTGLQKVFAYVGAFPLLSESKDAVGLVRLEPGNYTIVCATGTGDAGGDVLIEAYFLP